ncbi:phage/plasmid primase, P4 family [Methanospirillum sp.]
MGETDYIPDVSNLSFSIPDQLHQCRFIRVAVKGKNAIDQDWPGVSNYEVTDPNLTGHIINGGNYGILPREGICILDADDESKLKNFIEVIGDTLTVRTRKGLHLYFKCEGIDPNKVVLFDPITGDHVGELYPSGCRAYCLGPGCKHPSGSIYEVENRADIITIPLEKVLKAVSFYSKPKRNTADRNDNQPQKYESLPLSEVLGLRIESVAPPDEEIQHLSNGEIRGSNPWHGSESGTNYAINAQKNTWHCFRCGSGGDPATALAVKYGLIQCDEAGPGCLTADILQQIETRIRDGEEGPGYQKALIERDIEWKRSQVKKPAQVSTNYTQSPNNSISDTSVKSYNLTDLGNAERFVNTFGDQVKYCPTLKSWYVWNNQVWGLDNVNKRDLLAIDIVRSIYGEAEAETDEKLRVKIANWATSSESQQRRTAMMLTVSSLLSIHHDVLDAKPELFNLKNGTYNLESHEFREHRKEDLLTKLSKVNYNPDTECPNWNKHLSLVFNNDQDLINGFQELCGYSLLSGNPAEIFVVAWGNGRNGKGKTFDVITHIFGDYATNTPFSTFVVNKYSGGRGTASPELIDLIGKRFVRASESEEGARLAESLIKSLTGGDLITARGLYQGLVTYKPEFLIFLQTNHKPIIRNWDQAIEARLWLVPFDVYIEPQNRDYNILEKLISEDSGIFNWMLEGLKRYQERGRLQQPKRIQEATEEYKLEQDRLGEFVSSLCIKDPNVFSYRKAMYEAYHVDCIKNGVEPITQNSFSRLLQSHHGIREGPRKENGRTWLGIQLKNDPDTSDTFFSNQHNQGDLVNVIKKVSDVSSPSEIGSFPVENLQNSVISPDTLTLPDTLSKNNVREEIQEKKTGESDRKCHVSADVREWLSHNGFPDDLPVREYVTILPTEKRKGLHCYCKGCEDSFPLYWIPGRCHQLCQKHMNELRSLIEKEDNQ